jgi:hypothetical protein
VKLSAPWSTELKNARDFFMYLSFVYLIIFLVIKNCLYSMERW